MNGDERQLHHISVKGVLPSINCNQNSFCQQAFQPAQTSCRRFIQSLGFVGRENEFKIERGALFVKAFQYAPPFRCGRAEVAELVPADRAVSQMAVDGLQLIESRASRQNQSNAALVHQITQKLGGRWFMLAVVDAFHLSQEPMCFIDTHDTRSLLLDEVKENVAFAVYRVSGSISKWVLECSQQRAYQVTGCGLACSTNPDRTVAAGCKFSTTLTLTY